MPKTLLPAAVRHLTRYIAFKTVTTESNASFAREVGRCLERGGFSVSYQTVREENKRFVNVIGIKGKGGGRPLLLCSHLDTVSPGELKKWSRTNGNPWAARLKAKRVYGLGAADDKGPLVAMLQAACAIPSKKLKRPLAVMGTFGEESGMGGAKAFTRLWKRPKPCLAIVGEPTNLEITYRHKGVGVAVIELTVRKGGSRKTPGKEVKILFKGRQGHSSRPWLGDNALDKAIRFLKSKGKKIEGMGIGSFSGGYAPNIIPARAELGLKRDCGGTISAGALISCHDAVQSIVGKLRKQHDRTFYPPVITSNFGVAKLEKNKLSLIFDFRLLPGQPMKQIFSTLKKELSKRLSRYSEIKYRAWIERDNPPLDVRLNDAAPRFGRCLLLKNRLPVVLSVKPACTEAGVYLNWGVPALIFGPGESAGNIHAPNESIHVEQLKKAITFYSSVIEEVCVRGISCF